MRTQVLEVCLFGIRPTSLKLHTPHYTCALSPSNYVLEGRASRISQYGALHLTVGSGCSLSCAWVCVTPPTTGAGSIWGHHQPLFISMVTVADPRRPERSVTFDRNNELLRNVSHRITHQGTPLLMTGKTNETTPSPTLCHTRAMFRLSSKYVCWC